MRRRARDPAAVRPHRVSSAVCARGPILLISLNPVNNDNPQESADHWLLGGPICGVSSRPQITSLLASSDDIIDYTSPEFTSITASFQTQGLAPVDLVIDCTGGDTLQPILLSPSLVMKHGGKIVTIVAPIAVYGLKISEQMLRSRASANIGVEFFIVNRAARSLKCWANP
ncbi:uncharacterized protein Z518_10736 [Rhinocladiella mackenziei CBS 650.93]|uniref:Uncharacterized protein n=1 Tax=Rhinocladiella mackenziei CBS 650.93 TaxID=1442369 RepID=A0A0D2I235_9EURO|nr:uncharacterized protein Z518_10736 [Rhinocladiella mackenziei CBS 650.93]KIW99808.1 hypothetical protein Z518_10736 [Rhinocladiella mackenziei CBS 650.93]